MINYLYVLQGDYGHGWEDLTSEDKKDKGAFYRIKQTKKEYQTNEGGKYRIIERAEGEKLQYIVEITDTFGGELNYVWVKRFKLEARTMRGAICKLSKHYGGKWNIIYGDSELSTYKMRGACIACTIEIFDEDNHEGLDFEELF